MGWGRMLLLGNWGQQLDIEDQKQEIESLKEQLEARDRVRDTSTLQARVGRLERENSELRLYLASLIKYLGRQGVLRQDEFRSMVEAIDQEDGTADGGYQGQIMK
jgi:hypothetical protein